MNMKRILFGVGILCIAVVCYAAFDSDKPMVVIIPSYNNKDWYEKNLSRLFSQTYKKYRVIYIDDCSPDGTGDLVEKYIATQGQQRRVQLIRNQQNRGALANIYDAVHSCADYEIVVLLDGDDWFHTDQSLSIIADAYKDDNVLMTYGQYVEYPRGRSGHCRPIPAEVIRNNAYRSYDWVTSHPRTFYAWLFKKIDKKDFMFNGDFFQVTWDMAIMFPLLEMSAGRYRFIPDVLYEYNMATPLNDFKTKLRLQEYCNRVIRQRQRYAPLDTPYISEKHNQWWQKA